MRQAGLLALERPVGPRGSRRARREAGKRDGRGLADQPMVCILWMTQNGQGFGGFEVLVAEKMRILKNAALDWDESSTAATYSDPVLESTT